MVEAGESEYSGVLKTGNLLNFRDAQNERIGEIAPNWNVLGTRDSCLSVKFRSALPIVFSPLNRVQTFVVSVHRPHRLTHLLHDERKTHGLDEGATCRSHRNRVGARRGGRWHARTCQAHQLRVAGRVVANAQRG
jgi:hypothetical protein